MINLIDLLNVTGICPILAAAAPDSAVPAARALVEGGVPAVEVLMRDSNSIGNMERIAREVPEIIVGAGTVLSAEQAEQVIDLGAQFVVMPGFSRSVVEFCLKKGVLVVPGCVTASEMMMAQEYALRAVKFFPVYQMGGVETMEMLNGPFPDVRFITSGALDSENFLTTVRYKKTLAAGGDWMFADNNALQDRNYPEITRNLRRSVYKVLDMRAAEDAR